MGLFNWVTDTAAYISEEDIKNVVKLTFVKEVYSCWESNDYGEDFNLYTGFAVDGVTPRYFFKHYSREWYGGWTHDDITKWYEISEQEYIKLCAFKEN